MHTQLLRQVSGVGPVTALAYVLTLETPKRFARSRDVGPYLGLVPKQEDSGDIQPQLGISKAGDRMLRKLLVGSAHYILGPFGLDTDLRRFGMRLCERGGKNAKKRAAVAVARKLAVLLHRLWASGEVYEPLRQSTCLLYTSEFREVLSDRTLSRPRRCALGLRGFASYRQRIQIASCHSQ